MNIRLHKNFEKRYKKLRPNEQERFKQRRNLFLENEYAPMLQNHPLQGKYKGYRSINVSGDLRVVYARITDDTVIFITVDTHSNLYS